MSTRETMQVTPSAVGANMPQADAGISGTICNGAGADPASYADVALVPEALVMRTGLDGRFHFTGLLPGRYRLIVTQEGRTPEVVEVEIDRRGNADIDIPLFEAERADRPIPRSKGWPWLSVAEWYEKHASYIARTQRGGLDVVFYGDSITEQWQTTGADVWRNWVNEDCVASFGIGGDTTQNLLWRIGNGGDLAGLSPRVVVLLIGTNNFGFNKHRPDEVVDGITAIVDEIGRQLPKTQILLMGLLPRSPRSDARVRHLIREVNRGIATLAVRTGVRYLNIESDFITEDGNAREDLYTEDVLHLSEAGYRTWAKGVTPVLQEMLGQAVSARVFRLSPPQ